MNDNNSLAHTTWNCKYHIVFAPKYRRKILLQEYRVEMGKILRELCDWKGIKIIEAEICPRPCAHVCRDTAQNERIKFQVVSKREKQRNIPQKAWKSKVQIRKQVVLV